MKHLFLIFLFLSLTNCKEEKTTSIDNKEALIEDRFRENYRPQYHFTPPTMWMNDPNGLLYHNGTYHLFYQHYPEDIVWGPMHWGHATSKDLISWEHKPIALYPDELGLIFSGSAVMDIHNTSGLGTKDNPPMVAIFTYHLMEGEKAGRKDFQTQGIAYSLDEGETWKKYSGNPVISNDGNIKDFRDPKVFWDDNTEQWVMTLVAGDHAKFYSSPNLKDWTLMSEFGKNIGAHGGVWECPDLFPLKVEGSDETKWVLIISINPGAPNSGSGTQYFVGDFDGTTFTTNQKEIKWLDYGTDNYAGVTFNGLPDTDRTFIGWMSNWNYARDTPTEAWRSAMTLSRKLTLHKNNTNGFYLKNYPVASIDEYSYNTVEHDTMRSGMSLSSKNYNEQRLDFKIPGNLDDFELNFTNVNKESLKLSYDSSKSQFILDRTDSGITDFETSFGAKPHIAHAIIDDKDDVDFTIIMDTSSIEVFIDGGSTVFTDQIFPTTPFTALTFTSENATIANLKVSKIKRIWK
ncbi:glycoside hydrolase family 32 protein [Dokdonia donghaensis]|uniref:glycoside hydrolase family 32 protein n=1 Tax=Dokdonia donghaensis TaxID=326320 RepID=UPI00068D8C0B|nr:glycoside hydrolase family 32 protein [Dokdonia donghaensis]ANH59847.1 Levanase precursor [Dokdonia donghaensis DSW-1]